MNLRSRRNDDIEINVTSLIDVVFLLLIFFMVSTTFVHESQIKLTLPEASAQAPDTSPATVQVQIDAREHFSIAGKALPNDNVDTVKAALKAAVKGKKNPTIVISADAKSTHQSVVTAMDAARQLGLVHITFATRLPDDER